jgi:hypothetical protein
MISPSEVYDAHGQLIRRVKNLGWLLRHWKEAARAQVVVGDWRQAGDDDAILRVYLKDGRLYRTGFASKEVLWDWLDRPVFRGLPLDWHDACGRHTATTCGGTKPTTL